MSKTSKLHGNLFRPPEHYRLHIEGKVPSKKNRYRVGYNRSTGQRLFKDGTTTEYEQHAIWQLRAQWKGKPITDTMAIRLEFYRSGRMPDDVNVCETIYDCLQKAGVVKNDVQLVLSGNPAILRIKVRKGQDKTVIWLSPRSGIGTITNIS